MPSTLSNSNFNKDNECYWCQTNYPNYKPKGTDKLMELLEMNVSKSNSADCLVGISGGKDSSYVLIELQKTFGMKVEAFTYIHEGSIPIALENAKNLCKKLNVNHHVISLNNQIHLKTFKTFFSAWIESESTVCANMECVACKHLHMLAMELAKERNIPMVVWGHCPLEAPPFLAIKRDSTKEEGVKATGLLKNSLFLMKEMLHSDELFKGIIKHFSTCFHGCLSVSPSSQYLKLKYPSITNIYFFDYYEWNPHIILDELINKYNWEMPDAENDWHSDCVFNILKDYQFQKMFGVSYLDAYLSNQIRYGLITREDAWNKLVKQKKQCAGKIYDSLDFCELNHLKDKINISCFDIE